MSGEPTGYLPAALLLALVVALAGCSSPDSGTDSSASRKPTPAPTKATPSSTPITTIGSDCKPPEKVDFPDWMPADLPLPDGIFAFQDLPVVSGFHRGLFAVPKGDTTSFAKMVLREWPKAGYTLGHGDAEPGEVEDDFRKGAGAGAFKANDLPCKPALMQILLIYTKNAPSGALGIAPTPSGSPIGSKRKG